MRSQFLWSRGSIEDCNTLRNRQSALIESRKANCLTNDRKKCYVSAASLKCIRYGCGLTGSDGQIGFRVRMDT